MKKIRLLSLILAISILLCACKGKNDGTAFEGSSTVKKFINYINDYKYLEAIDYYNQEMYGDYSFESEATDGIVSLLKELNEDVLNGKKNESDSKKVIGVIDNVLNETNIYIENYDVIVEEIELSVASKAAFLAAKELEELKNYADAITEYRKVIETDPNYNEAQAAIESCAVALKQIVFDKIAPLVEKGEYTEAIAQLSALSEKIPNDPEITAKISVYEKTYISGIISKAEEEFVVPSEDYSKSLSTINGALQFYPDNQELLSKKDYYYSFAPIKMASLPQYDNSGKYGPAFLESEKDPLGTLHTDVFRTWSHMYDTAWVVYVLDGKYNKLTFTVYGTLPSDKEIASVSIRDYSKGDYELSTVLYMDETLQRGVFPYEVEVDVTGVKMIRVFVDYGLAVADAQLQRTVK